LYNTYTYIEFDFVGTGQFSSIGLTNATYHYHTALIGGKYDNANNTLVVLKTGYHAYSYNSSNIIQTIEWRARDNSSYSVVRADWVTE